jgi:hypothetical protein
MIRRLAAVIVILAMFLSACSPTELIKEDRFFEREHPPVTLGSDPLKLAYFKMLANEAGIPYRRDSEGNYTAVKSKDTKQLAKLAKQAESATFIQEKKSVKQTCATRRLQGYLRVKSVLSAFVQDEDGYYLIMDAKDYSAEGIEERLKEFEEQCARDDAARKAREEAAGY